MKKLLVIIIVIISNYSFSQSDTGTSGLIHIPSARMLEDGQLVLGASYIPKPYFQRYNRRVNPGLNTYLTYGILPFVEIMFRYTHELNIPVNNETQYFPDRMGSLRIRLLSEKIKLPSIVIGFQDLTFLTNTCIRCQNYTATYIVFSKEFDSVLGSFDLSLGYAHNLFDLKRVDFDGFFGGFEFFPTTNNKGSIIFEHNTEYFNTGIKLYPSRNINMMIGLRNFDQLTYALNFLL